MSVYQGLLALEELLVNLWQAIANVTAEAQSYFTLNDFSEWFMVAENLAVKVCAFVHV